MPATNPIPGEDRNQRQTPGVTKPGRSLINVQGAGVGLPPGVGDGNAAPQCAGADDRSQACKPQGKSAEEGAQHVREAAETNPGAAKPTDTRLQGTGIGTPACFGDSRDSAGCK